MTSKKEEYNNRYRKENVKSVLVRFYPSERDLFAHLEQQEAKATYIKDLIRQDIKNGA